MGRGGKSKPRKCMRFAKYNFKVPFPDNIGLRCTELIQGPVKLWPGYAVLGCWNQKSSGNSQIEEIQVVNLQNLFVLITSPVLSAFPCIGVGHFHRFRSTIACKAISYSLPYQARWGSKSWMTYPTSDVHLIALGLNVDECWKFDVWC